MVSLFSFVCLTIYHDGQNWRASVKSTHFVLAIRDYYHDGLAVFDLKQQNARKIPVRSSTVSGGEQLEQTYGREEVIRFPHAKVYSSDEWAIPYLRVDRLRYVLDAIDADTSGFITVKELEAFSRERPANWR